jgi:SAM-dependent methyltransferase
MSAESENIIGLYERQAQHWVADRSRTGVSFEKPWLDRFIAGLPAGKTILDIGCGSGQPIADYLVAQGYQVTGIDSSPSLIAACCSRLPSQRWLVADMRSLALAERFAGLIAWDSFFHLTPVDQRRMFPVFRAHAASGAALLFTSGPRHGEAVGEFHGEPLYHASLAPDEYRSLLAANGFAVITEKMEDPDCGGHSVWLARRNEDR